MAFDSVPWFVGGGAVHSPEVARAALYAATGGKEGVSLPGDLKVVPLAVPGGGVQVRVGNALILNREAGGAQQTYEVRNPTSTTVDIPATGSANAQSYLIVVRIEDPNMPGGSRWTDWVDRLSGPYVFARAIPCPANATNLQDYANYVNDSAITLARVDLPKSTGTVTSAMITDLRDLANPRTERQIVGGALTGADRVLNTETWQSFPQNPIALTVPPWATHAAIRLETTVRAVSGDTYFWMQAFIGPTQDGDHLFSDIKFDGIAVNTGNQMRAPIILPTNGPMALPSDVRGKRVNLTSRVKAANTNGGRIGEAKEDYYLADATFLELRA